MSRPTLAWLIPLASTCSACGLLGGAGYTNRLPFDTSGGVALRFAMLGPEALEGEGTSVAMLVDADFGTFGWREAAYLGAVHGWGELPIGFVRGGIAPVSLGHEEGDRDPDPWVGVSATVQSGFWIPFDDLRLEVGVGAVAETGWTGAGAGAYVGVWVGLGKLIGVDLDFYSR